MSGSAATFSGLIDLAAADLGGRVLGASDEFFAEADNLLQPGRGVFIDGKFTDRGKWMDGWESRRKRGGRPRLVRAGAGRAGPGGRASTSTRSTSAATIRRSRRSTASGRPRTPTCAALGARDDWAPLLDQAPLRPDAQNLFAAGPGGAVTHLRLNIFPDGGVARFRAFGRVHAALGSPARSVDAGARAHVEPDLRDLAAVKNGGVALACSDAFFGPMNNLLLPGPPGGHGRRLGDAAPARPGARLDPGPPGRARRAGGRRGRHGPLQGELPRPLRDGGGRSAGRRADHRPAGVGRLAPAGRPVEAARRRAALLSRSPAGPATHVRLNIFPDGGVARLRVWGHPGG